MSVRKKIYLLGYYMKINIKKLTVYKGELIFNIFATFLWIASGLFNVIILFNSITGMCGWTFSDMIMLYGMWSLTFSIYNIFGNGILEVENHVINGTMDTILIKPISPLFQIVFSRISPSGIAFFLFGFIFMSYSSIYVDIAWNLGKVIYMIVSIIVGGGLIFSTYLMLATLSFWCFKSNIAIKIGYDIHKFAQYPIDIYGKGIKLLLITCFPYAFTNYYPISYLLGKSSIIVAIFSLIIGFFFIIMSFILWNKGLRRYESSGS